MSYEDRVNREFVETIRADRLDEIKQAGLLLNDKTRGPIEFKIAEETRLPSAVVRDIVDMINGTVGQSVLSAKDQTPAQTISEIKEAFGSHVTNPKFLDRIAKDIAQQLEGPLKDREERIVTAKMAPASPAISTPAMAVSAPANKS